MLSKDPLQLTAADQYAKSDSPIMAPMGMCESAHYSGLIFMHDAGFCVFFGGGGVHVNFSHDIIGRGSVFGVCVCVTLRMQTSQLAVAVICSVTRLHRAYQIKDNLRLLNCLS